MDNFVIGWTAALVAVGIGYGIGLYHAGLFKKEKKIEPGWKPQVTVRGLPIIKEDEPEPKKPDLGAVRRPDPDDLEKKERPVIKDEEEAWEEDIDLLPGVSKMFASPYAKAWTS